MNETIKKPFKGLHYYEEEDRDIFYGRAKEAKELANLVELNPLTLVFGKSGIGKTSLLNAGLFPLLRQKYYLPVRIRLGYARDGLPLVSQIKRELAAQLAEHDVQVSQKGGTVCATTLEEGESLWQFFRRVDFMATGEGATAIPVTPVMVLDQFEEFFTLGKHHAERQELIEVLYGLIEDQVPSDLEESILSGRETFPYLREESHFRMVLGLREDYLPHMNELKESIPSLHRVLYRVIHLNGHQAREVMDKAGVFKDEVIKQEILDQFLPEDREPGKVTANQLEVEPALFSLLCDQVYEKGVASLTKKAKDEILAGFYQQILEQVPQKEVLAQWIEEHLLTEGGFRTPCYLERQFGLRQGIETAINKKLLRKLYIGDKEHVEIIHDVLAPVIHQRKQKRLEEQKRKRMIRITGMVSLVAIFSILLTIFAFMQKKRADEQYKEAIQQKKIATQNEQKALEEKKRADEQTMAAITQKNLATQNEQKALLEKKRADEQFKIAIQEKKRADKQTSEADNQKNIANQNEQKAFEEKKRADEQYKIVISNRLASEAELILSNDNYKAIRIAEAAYKIGLPVPSPPVLRSLSAASFTTLRSPFYSRSFNHKGIVVTAVFSPDGLRVLTASWDKTAKLWDTQGNILVEFKGHAHVIWNAVFSPDGLRVLTASADNTAKLWDTRGKILAEFKGHTGIVISAVFSPDGQRVLTASADNTAKLWNTQGKKLAEFKGHTDSLTSAVFSPDGKRVLTASADNTAKLWDTQGKKLAEFKGHTDSVQSAVFSPDGLRVLTASADNTSKLWNTQGKMLMEFKVESKGYIWWAINAVFSSDGQQVLTTSLDNTAKLWDIQGKVVAKFKGHTPNVSSIAFSPDGLRALTTSKSNNLKLRYTQGEWVAESKENTEVITGIMSSWDGQPVLSDLSEDSAELWDTQGKLVVEFKGHTDEITSAVFSPDGQRVLTASADNTAKLWDTQGKILAEFKGHTDRVTSAVFSPDGQRVLTTSWDKTAKLWDTQGNPVAEFKEHTDEITSAVFSPDGKYIISTSSDGASLIWPTPEGIMEYLKTAPFPKLTREEKKELGIEGFNID